MPKQTFLHSLQQLKCGDVFTDQLHLNLYSTDASNYQVMPIAVLFPRTVDDVQKAVKCAFEHKIPVISRGGGSSLSGQSIGAGLIIDYTKYMNQLVWMDSPKHLVTVQTGITLDALNRRLKEKGQMIGPDPSSSVVATIGGMIGNNTTGAHSIVYGQMIDHVVATDVILADGTLITCTKKSKEDIALLLEKNNEEAKLYKEVLQVLEEYQNEITNDYPKTWRNVAGYNLNRLYQEYLKDGSINLASLIVGSEGTLGTIVSAKVKTLDIPKVTRLALVHFNDIVKACEAVPSLLETNPTAIELSNDYFTQLVAGHPVYRDIQSQFIIGNPAIVLIVEYSADTPEDLDKQIEIMRVKLQEIKHDDHVVLRTTPEEMKDVWMMRKAGFGLLMSKRGDDKPLSFADDAAVPVNKLSEFLPELNQLFEAQGIKVALVGHASAGCVHINPNINLKTQKGIEQMKTLSIQIAETAIKYKGTTSGEHGEGLARSYYNEQLYGTRLHQAFKHIKSVFDPNNLMQPGKIVNASEPWDTTLLRFNPQYKTPLTPTETMLDFSNDGGFNGLVEMCNGMGFCRKEEGGVMCPSYRATRDERHSTRGRANALRAAIKGDLPKGLSDKSVFETLDLCLECKACKSECPSMVDMAKLKYEYLYQYQLKNGFSIKNKVFANIHVLNKTLKPLARVSNFLFRNKIFKYALQSTMGIDSRRTFPSFAKESFQDWFAKRKTTINIENSDKEIILWDDTYITFNNPNIGISAVKILEAAGYRIRILSERVCCGRPMISKGLLESAKRNAATNVKLLLPYAQKGIPIIGLEPSCIATFKDEYPDLLKNEEAKIVASKSYFYEDFLIQLWKDQELNIHLTSVPNIKNILVHNHCYQKAIGKPQNTIDLLQLIPETKVEEIQSGCCGMAGSFGYEKKHYEVSMACGEETLFPAVRNKNEQTCIAASGISCRHQIEDGTGIEALHPLEILALALH